MARETLREAEQEVVINGCRWARNILMELQSNFGMRMTKEARELLLTATQALGKLDVVLFEQQSPENPDT